MAWDDDWLEASLGGVLFHVQASELCVGRRVVVHEYPGRDLPSHEDLGRIARRYELTAYVIGPGYRQVREDLLTVLETGGPLTLVHPLDGEVQVVVHGEIRVRESSKQGGMAWFPLVLVESGLAPWITTYVEDVSAVKEATHVAAKALQTSMAKAFKPKGFLGKLTALLHALTSKLRSVHGMIDAKLNALENFSMAIDALENEVQALLQTPDRLLAELSGLLRKLTGPLSSKPRTPERSATPELHMQLAYDLHTTLWSSGSEISSVPGSTLKSQEEAKEQHRLQRALQSTVLLESCHAFAGLSYPHDKAIFAVQMLVQASFEELWFDPVPVLDDPVVSAMVDVQATLLRHLSRLHVSLPRLRSHTLFESEPALLLAYRLYGDAQRDEDLVRLNQWTHPGFLPAHVPLKVLSHGPS